MRKTHLLIVPVIALAMSVPSSAQIGSFLHSLVGENKVSNARPVPTPVIPPKDPHLTYVQFLALGDFGTGGDGQKEVAAAMAKKAAAEPVRFIMSTGDNIYERGVTSVTDPQWKEKFEDVYSQPTLRVPFYAVLGNHDYGRNAQAQIEYTAVSSHWKMPDYYYTVSVPVDDSTAIQFFCIETTPMAKVNPEDVPTLPESSPIRRQAHWLDSTLAASHARWKVVVGHHTIYSGGDHGDNPGLQALLGPIMERHRVDIYLCGHDHDLQLIGPIKGTTYVVSGAGGKRRDTTWRDNTLFAATNYGFNFFRVSARDILIEYLDRSDTVRFAYQIVK